MTRIDAVGLVPGAAGPSGVPPLSEQIDELDQFIAAILLAPVATDTHRVTRSMQSRSVARTGPRRSCEGDEPASLLGSILLGEGVQPGMIPFSFPRVSAAGSPGNRAGLDCRK